MVKFETEQKIKSKVEKQIIPLKLRKKILFIFLYQLMLIQECDGRNIVIARNLINRLEQIDLVDNDLGQIKYNALTNSTLLNVTTENVPIVVKQVLHCNPAETTAPSGNHLIVPKRSMHSDNISSSNSLMVRKPGMGSHYEDDDAYYYDCDANYDEDSNLPVVRKKARRRQMSQNRKMIRDCPEAIMFVTINTRNVDEMSELAKAQQSHLNQKLKVDIPLSQDDKPINDSLSLVPNIAGRLDPSTEYEWEIKLHGKWVKLNEYFENVEENKRPTVWEKRTLRLVVKNNDDNEDEIFEDVFAEQFPERLEHHHKPKLIQIPMAPKKTIDPDAIIASVNHANSDQDEDEVQNNDKVIETTTSDTTKLITKQAPKEEPTLPDSLKKRWHVINDLVKNKKEAVVQNIAPANTNQLTKPEPQPKVEVKSKVDVQPDINIFSNIGRDVLMCKGDNITIKGNIRAENVDKEDIYFQWVKYNESKRHWENIEDANEENLTIKHAIISKSGKYKLTMICYGKKYSSNAINIDVVEVLTAIPQVLKVKEGKDLLIEPELSLDNIKLSQLKYQWFFSPAQDCWEPLSNNIKSSKQRKLSIERLPYCPTDIQFRLRIYSAEGTLLATSNPCLVEIKQAIPSVKIVCSQLIECDQHSRLEINPVIRSALKGNLYYQWQICQMGDTEFENIPNQTRPQFVVDPVGLDLNNARLRLQVLTKSSTNEIYEFYSNDVSLVVNETIIIDLPSSKHVNLFEDELTINDTDTTMKKYFFTNSEEFTRNRSNFTYKIFYILNGIKDAKENTTNSFMNVRTPEDYNGQIQVRVELYAKPGFIFSNKLNTISTSATITNNRNQFVTN